jgi:hypothetical protein
LQKTVREVADPVALTLAVALPTRLRYLAWRDFVNQTRQSNGQQNNETASMYSQSPIAPITNTAEHVSPSEKLVTGPASEEAISRLQQTW